MLKSSTIIDWNKNFPLFVDTAWLEENHSNPNIKIIDGTWLIPGAIDDLPQGVIPKAQFFDLGALKSQSKLGAPYPPAHVMQKMASELSIENDDHIIVYDRQGLFSAPRVAWSFLTIGHRKISLLQEGFPQWLKDGCNVVNSHAEKQAVRNYKISPSLVKGVEIAEVIAAIESDIQIIDARSEARFYGNVPEPRPNLRSGHIPNSINLPLTKLKNHDGKLLKDVELQDIIVTAGIDMERPIITSCGSGVTAAALAFIFFALGKQDIAVYSGSWAEYGATEHPIQTDR